MSKKNSSVSQLSWMLGIALVLTFACMGKGLADEPLIGRLVIVGGALDSKHAAIYEALLATTSDDLPVGIIPLASGLPEESGAKSVQTIRQYAENPERVFDTELTSKEPEKAADAACAESLSNCGAIWFTGGVQSRIVSAMRPESGDSLCYAAVCQVLASGGTVGGSSAGAAIMSDPMIRGGRSEEAMLLGATDKSDGDGVSVGQGMALFPYGLSDQHFLQRGRFGRLLVALETTEQRLGFGVSENAALVVDLGTGMMSALGDQAVTIIDRKQVAKTGHARQNIRVHLLSHGDTYDANTDRVAPSAAKRPIVRNASDETREINVPGVWNRNVISQMIALLSANPTASVRSDDSNFDYVMTADQNTEFFSLAGAGAAGVTAINVRFDITPRVDIEERIVMRRARNKKSAPLSQGVDD